jgi:hypothetical protein
LACLALRLLIRLMPAAHLRIPSTISSTDAPPRPSLPRGLFLTKSVALKGRLPCFSHWLRISAATRPALREAAYCCSYSSSFSSSMNWTISRGVSLRSVS